MFTTNWFNMPGVIHVSYDALISDYQIHMSALLHRLGHTNTSPVSVPEHVGWAPK